MSLSQDVVVNVGFNINDSDLKKIQQVQNSIKNKSAVFNVGVNIQQDAMQSLQAFQASMNSVAKRAKRLRNSLNLVDTTFFITNITQAKNSVDRLITSIHTAVMQTASLSRAMKNTHIAFDDSPAKLKESVIYRNDVYESAKPNQKRNNSQREVNTFNKSVNTFSRSIGIFTRGSAYLGGFASALRPLAFLSGGNLALAGAGLYAGYSTYNTAKNAVKLSSNKFMYDTTDEEQMKLSEFARKYNISQDNLNKSFSSYREKHKLSNLSIIDYIDRMQSYVRQSPENARRALKTYQGVTAQDVYGLTKASSIRNVSERYSQEDQKELEKFYNNINKASEALSKLSDNIGIGIAQTANKSIEWMDKSIDWFNGKFNKGYAEDGREFDNFIHRTFDEFINRNDSKTTILKDNIDKPQKRQKRSYSGEELKKLYDIIEKEEYEEKAKNESKRIQTVVDSNNYGNVRNITFNVTNNNSQFDEKYLAKYFIDLLNSETSNNLIY